MGDDAWLEAEPEPYVVPLDVEGTEVLSFDTSRLGGGWASYFSDHVGLPHPLGVLMRVGPTAKPADAAPLEVRELHVVVAPDSAGFSSGAFRGLPIMRVEAAVNQPVHREVLLPLVGLPDLATGTTLGGVRFRLRPEVPVKPPRRPRLNIVDPGGYRKPDGFYRQVADRYLWLAAVSPRPAQELAEANDMPVATVHRWVREAKARGLLLLPSHRG